MILYFTATGNSRYVAQALAHRLNDEIVCLNPYIKEGKKGAFVSEKPFVFVFPVYLSTAPAIFRTFILESEFKGSKDAYFVPTCASTAGAVPNAMRELCLQSGKLQFMGSRKVPMPQNYILYFRMSDEEKKRNDLIECETLTAEICSKIEKGEALEDKPVGALEYSATKWVEKWYNRCFTRTRPFYATDACVGCGACAKLCPTNSIAIKEGKPVWTRKVCIHCVACINGCPAQAIEFGKRTKGKPRYTCPPYKKS